MNNILIVQLLSGLFGGKVPINVLNFILKLIPEVAQLVRDLKRIKKDDQGRDVDGPDKAEAAVRIIAEMIDEDLDDLPEWSNLSEDRRDRMIYGLVEWVYWGIDLNDKHGERRTNKIFKKALKRLSER